MIDSIAEKHINVGTVGLIMIVESRHQLFSYCNRCFAFRTSQQGFNIKLIIWLWSGSIIVIVDFSRQIDLSIN